jgi:hypothetical protein
VTPPRPWPRIGPPTGDDLTPPARAASQKAIQTHGNIVKKVDVCAAVRDHAERSILVADLGRRWHRHDRHANALLTGATLCAFNVRQKV